MTTEPARRMHSYFTEAAQWLRRRAWHMALVLASAGLAGLLGYGLLNTVLPLVGGHTGLAGALVAALVVLGVLPLALWARVPALPRALWRPSTVKPTSAAAKPGPAATVTPLRSAGTPGVPPGATAPTGASMAGGPGAPVANSAARPPLYTADVFAAALAPAVAAASASASALATPLAPAAASALDLNLSVAGDVAGPVRDALTGAYSQQHFVAAADREWSRIRRHAEDAALLMIDIDRLKGVNDRYGAGCGDSLLVEITRQVSGTLRQYDLLARFGGGVLVVFLPHTDPMGALDVAERIRERVAALRVSWESHSVRSTVSVGVAAIGASHGTLDEVIADAGAALREAKASGRNCVRAAPIPPRRSGHLGFPLGANRPAGPL